jgi:hypothetical protein
MRKLAIAVLLVLATALPLAAKHKKKDKRFDPVAVNTLSEAAGRYVGIDPGFVIELDGTGGSLRNFKQTARLTNLRVDGSELTATAIYPNGRREELRATFVNRTKNGEVAFGMVVRNADIWIDENMMIQDLFCRRE